MDEDWRNAFGILMCKDICDGAGAGICDDAPSTCSSNILLLNGCFYIGPITGSRAVVLAQGLLYWPRTCYRINVKTSIS